MSEQHRIVLTKTATRDLAKLDKGIAKRIITKLRLYAAADNPLHYAKQLKGMDATYRFRIGDYRAIFELQADGTYVIFLILRIKHRKDVY